MKNLEELIDQKTEEVVGIFEKGDNICHENNYRAGFFMFSIATDYDVQNFSGKNGAYIKKKKLEK